MRDRIRRALDEADDHVERARTSEGSYRFADWTVRVRIAAKQRADDLLRMIEHRRMTESAAADWEIVVIEGGHASLEPLRPPPGYDKRLVEITNDHYYYWAPDCGGSLTLVDRGRCRALLWYPLPGEIASWEFSKPFLHSIHALVLPTGWAPVHAAAVARNGAAILIAGHSKVGKTTTALVCAEAGWDYLSDDVVLVGGTPWRASGIYRSARMREDMFAHLPRSMSAVTNISADEGEVRAEVDVGQMGCIGAGDVQIQAIVLPQRAGAAHAALVPTRPSQALRALATTSLLLAGGHTDNFKKVTELVKAVPCYTFDPGPSMADIPEALARALNCG